MTDLDDVELVPYVPEEPTFGDLVTAFYAFDDATGKARGEAEKRHALIAERFEAMHGKVNESVSSLFTAAIWYGDKPSLRIWSVVGSDDAIPAELDNVFLRLRFMEDEARALLNGASLRRFMDMCYEAFADAIYAADRFIADDAPATTARILLTSKQSADQARQLLTSLVQRQAQLHYFAGMVLGALALGALAAAVSFVGPLLTRADATSADTMAACVVGGSLGAVFSVLSRMHSGTLRLDPDSGAAMLRLLGGVRPVVGAVAGIALFLLIDGEALPVLSKPAPSAGAIAYYAALAFVAGFSERWFQDMLALARGTASENRMEPDDLGAGTEEPALASQTPKTKTRRPGRRARTDPGK